MTKKKQKQPKAKVFIWPNLTDDDKGEVEAQCIESGYTAKRWVRVGRVKCWEVS